MRPLMYHSHQTISALHSDKFIFIFGSNLAGVHGAGAARVALQNFGAVWGQGFGLHGQSFAIPTKDEEIETLPKIAIDTYVKGMLTEIERNPNKVFVLTEIGCGLAGYTAADIAPLFSSYVDACVFGEHVNNLIFPEAFAQVLFDLYSDKDCIPFEKMDVSDYII